MSESSPKAERALAKALYCAIAHHAIGEGRMVFGADFFLLAVMPESQGRKKSGGATPAANQLATSHLEDSENTKLIYYIKSC